MGLFDSLRAGTRQVGQFLNEPGPISSMSDEEFEQKFPFTNFVGRGAGIPEFGQTLKQSTEDLGRGVAAASEVMGDALGRINDFIANANPRAVKAVLNLLEALSDGRDRENK